MRVEVQGDQLALINEQEKSCVFIPFAAVAAWAELLDVGPEGATAAILASHTPGTVEPVWERVYDAATGRAKEEALVMRGAPASTRPAAMSVGLEPVGAVQRQAQAAFTTAPIPTVLADVLAQRAPTILAAREAFRQTLLKESE